MKMACAKSLSNMMQHCSAQVACNITAAACSSIKLAAMSTAVKRHVTCMWQESGSHWLASVCHC